MITEGDSFDHVEGIFAPGTQVGQENDLLFWINDTESFLIDSDANSLVHSRADG